MFGCLLNGPCHVARESESIVLMTNGGVCLVNIPKAIMCPRESAKWILASFKRNFVGTARKDDPVGNPGLGARRSSVLSCLSLEKTKGYP